MIVRLVTRYYPVKIAPCGDMTYMTPVTPFVRTRNVKLECGACMCTSHEARNPVIGVTIVLVLLEKILGVTRSVISGVIRFEAVDFGGVLS